MKRNWTSMTGASFGLSLEAAVAPAGGAPAPAAPAPAAPAPAPAAPAPAPAAATPAPAAAPAPEKSGFFAGLKRAETSTPAAVEPTAKVQVLSDDKKTVLFEGTKADADAYVAKNAPAPVVPTGTALPRQFMGRDDLKTIEDVENLVRLSGVESAKNKERAARADAAVAAAKVDAEAKMAALTKELELARQTPAKPELSKEQLNALWKENPAEAAQYMQDHKDRAENLRLSKEGAEREVRERAERTQKGAKQAGANYEAMTKDAKTYPKFNDLIPRIDAIYDRLPEDRKAQFDSDPEGPKTLYTMAMGELYIELNGKGIETQAEAAEAARLKAASDAATARAAGGADPATPPDTRTDKQKSDQEWRDSRAKARGENPGTRIFRGRPTA